MIEFSCTTKIDSLAVYLPARDVAPGLYERLEEFYLPDFTKLEKEIARLIRQCPKLRSLSVACLDSLQDVQLKKLLDVVTENRSIKKFSLKMCLKLDTFFVLNELFECPHLRDLELNFTPIKPNAQNERFFEKLARARFLKRFSLSGQFDKDFIDHTLKGMTRNKSVRVFTLDGQKSINAEEFMDILQSLLIKNDALRELHIGGLLFNLEDFTEFMDMIRENKTLEVVEVSRQSFDETYVNKAIEMLNERAHPLNEFKLSGITEEQKKRIEMKVAQNRAMRQRISC